MLMNASHAILPLLFGFGGSVIGAASAFWATGALMVGAGAKIGYSVRNMRDPAEKLVEDKAIEQEENIDFKKMTNNPVVIARGNINKVITYGYFSVE